MYIVNLTSGCTHEEASFVSLDDLDNISVSLDKDLEEKLLIYLMKYFYFQVSDMPISSRYESGELMLLIC